MNKYRLIIVLALISVSITLPAQNRIKLFPKAALSYTDEHYEISEQVLAHTEMPYMTTRIGLELQYKNFSVYSDNKFWMKADLKDKSFTPSQAEFTFGVSYHLTQKINITAEHVCLHPIYTDNGKGINGICGGKNEITISYGY